MNNFIKYFLFIVSFSLISLFVFSQSKEELEKQRKQKQKEIEYTKKLINETNEKQKQTITFLNTLNKQINSREELISTVSKEIKYINEQIENNKGVIESLQKDLENLKKEYANMLCFAYKNRNTYNKIGFILSAKTFNQSFQRLKLLQHYSSYRKNQMKLIDKTTKSIETKVALLEVQKKNKVSLLAKQNLEKKQLEKDKSSKSNIVVKLKKKKKELKKELKEKEKIAAELKKKIKNLIASTMTKASKNYYLTPEAKKLSLDFVNNRSKLPWPVEKGFISETFGKHLHPTLKNVYIVNNGIKIKTNKNANARAIFNGKVSNVIRIPGAGTSVLINHGQYFSVYSNLSNVSVSAGEIVSTKQVIGKIAYDSRSGSTEMELQIWKMKQNLNPIYWIAPR